MAIESGFFTSKNNDRLYDGESLGSIFDGILTEGVFRNYKNSLFVRSYHNNPASSDPSMRSAWIVVETGKAWINHSFITNTSDLTLTLTSSGTWYVAIEFNNASARRNNIVLTRALANSSYIKHIPLAKIIVPSNLGVTQSDIEDLRGTSQCPFVTAPLEIISADDILAQWRSQFNDFITASQTRFNTYLNSTAPTALTTEVNRLFNDYKTTLQMQWNSWYNTNTVVFKKQWDDWFAAMTEGKEEALDNWWDEKKEELVLSMIEQWDNWYTPFVEEKEKAFADWEKLYQESTETVVKELDNFNEKIKEIDAVKDDIIEEMEEKSKVAIDNIQNKDKELERLIEDIKRQGVGTLPYVLDLEDDEGDKILDSDGEVIQSFNFVLTL